MKKINGADAKVFCDGIFLSFILKILNININYQTGPDFLEMLIKKYEREASTNILIIFANEHQRATAIKKLNFKYQSLICDTMFQDGNTDIEEFVRKVEPKREIVISIGSPWQDIIARRLSEVKEFRECNIYCVGAAMNFQLGIIERRSLFVRYNLEWLNRLICEPRKTRPRILITPILVTFIAAVKPQRIRDFLTIND